MSEQVVERGVQGVDHSTGIYDLIFIQEIHIPILASEVKNGWSNVNARLALGFTFLMKKGQCQSVGGYRMWVFANRKHLE